MPDAEGTPVTTALYREKAEIIQASCFEANNDDGSHIAALVGWANSKAPKHQHAWTDGTRIFLEDLDAGRKVLDVGDWLLLHEDGRLSAFSRQTFELSYEPLPTEAVPS